MKYHEIEGVCGGCGGIMADCGSPTTDDSPPEGARVYCCECGHLMFADGEGQLREPSLAEVCCWSEEEWSEILEVQEVLA